MAGGFAAGIVFPRTAADAAALVASARQVLPIGAQSSLTGGATPRGELLLSTRALTGIDVLSRSAVRAGAGVPLADLQRALASHGLYYPPVPTFEGAFVGGTIATNAAGAATFKYGSTRRWVEAVTIVLADGAVVTLGRGQAIASPDGVFELAYPSGRIVQIPVPQYRMPDVPKLSAGYYARTGMDLIDLFIGSEGTLGIIVDATLRVIPRPRRSLVLVTCDSEAQALAVTAALRQEAALSWRGEGPLDVAAIEYIDDRSLARLPAETFARAGVPRPTPSSVLLLAQVEVPNDDTAAMERLADVLGACGVADDPRIAAPADEREAARLLELREAVPAAVNAEIAAAKARVDPGLEKTAGDFVVPFERLDAALALYRETFEREGLEYAIWGHLSDGNLHPNVVPRSVDDMHRGTRALLEIARRVIAMGGAPLAEHGVGRSPLKQQMLRELYGEAGIAEMRAVKRALDPAWKLAPGVIVPSE
ncbi:MAG: FAD-binding oxidoreductase [Acidobacteria bacterium]|nr:FAD-binding oxidoreductase [Acidobacteriota bacterium]